MYEDRAEARLPIFYGNSGEVSSLWKLREKSALRDKDLF